MKLFARRPRLAPQAETALGLAPRERVLAFQPLDEGTIVATDHRVVVLDDEQRLVAARAWHEVDSASWDRDTSSLRVSWVDGAPSWAFGLRTPEPDLMTTVRARVQSTLVASAAAKVDGRTVRVVLRRDLPTDSLFFQHQFAQGLRPGDPRVSAAVAELEADLRDDAGLPPTWSGLPPTT